MVSVSSGTNVTIFLKLNGNGTGDILTVNIRCAFSDYLLFEEF